MPAWEGPSPAGVYVVVLLPSLEEALSPGKGGTACIIFELPPSPEGR